MDFLVSCRKTYASQVYAGKIIVDDTAAEYKVKFESNGLISDSAELYNASDVYQGTIQSLIIDNSYTSRWIEAYDATENYTWVPPTSAVRPLMIDAGTPYCKYDGTHYSLGKTGYYQSNFQNTGGNPKTMVCVGYDWTSGYIYGGSNTGNGGIYKDGDDKARFQSWYDNIGISSGTISDTGLVQMAVAYDENGLTDSKDYNLAIDGSFEGESEGAVSVNFRGDRWVWLGAMYASGSDFPGHRMEYFRTTTIMSGSDLSDIWTNQQGGF
ncbi:MAG: hypothetical protein U9P90_02245 [Patescibacteria group bacterium]|nr:hypothetical protein [Patescibacteria group bacterium]